MMKKDKVILIGIDGTYLDIFLDLSKKAITPTFQAIIASGAYGRLKSTIPPHTCPAWTSSVTGVNIAKHGIYDFFLSTDLKRKRITFADSTKRKSEAIWNTLSELGKKIIVLNFPVSYPPEEVNGVMVSGMLTPSLKSDYTYPRNIKYELEELEYQIDIGGMLLDKLMLYRNSKIRMLLKIKEMITRRAKVAEYLMKEFDWDFFIVVFVALDRLFHWYWKYIDPTHIAYNPKESEILGPYIQDIFVEMDRAIKQLIKDAGENVNTILYSDHGFAPVNKFFFTNSLLLKHKILETESKGKVSGLINQQFIFDTIMKLHLSRLITKLPKGLKRKVGNLIPPSNTFLDIFQVDALKTKAFHLGNYIRINEGFVDSDTQRESIKNKVIELFNKKISPLGLRAYKKEDLYKGIWIKDIPDIVLLSQKDIYHNQLIPVNGALLMNYSSSITNPSLMWCGQHALYGLIMMVGPKIKQGFKIKDAEIVDIAPTSLYLLGESVPHHMDGKILKNALH